MGWIERILNSINAGVLIISPDHRVVYANKKACEWFTPLEVGKKRRCYRTMEYGEDFCLMCPTRNAIDLSVPVRYEFPLWKDGKERVYEVIGIPVWRKGRPEGAVEIVLDISEKGMERAKVHELMIQIEKMAALGRLAAGIAHELNTPLATLSIIVQELKDILHVASADGDLKEALKDMEEQIERCKEIIRDLLVFSRREEAQISETDINALVLKAIELLKKGEVKGLEIVHLLDPSLPKLMTDHKRFYQVLLNIMRNAIEALEEKGGRIDVATALRDGFVEITIEDNGPGIKDEDLRRIFEPFFTTKPPGKGTGLGLFVSYCIMRDLGGEIRVESRYREGTKVCLSLPIQGKDETPHR